MSTFALPLYAATALGKTHKKTAYDEKLYQLQLQAMTRYEKILKLLHEKTDIVLLYPFFKEIEAYEGEPDIIEISGFLEKCHFERLSDKEWASLVEQFKKLNEKSKKKAVQQLFFEDEKLTAQEFLIQMPAFLRKQKADEKLDLQKKEACEVLQKEYDATKENSTLDNLLLVVLGIFRGSFNQDISMGKAKIVNEIIPVIPALTYRKQLYYFGKKIPELIKYFRQNKNYSKSEIEINKAKEDYIVEHLSDDIINDLSKIAAQTGFMQKIDPTFESKYKSEYGMIPYKEAARNLIKEHCTFLPCYLFYPAQLIMTSVLYNIGPAFINILVKETTKADASLMTLEEKLQWDHLRKDDNFAFYLASFISSFCSAGVLQPLNATLGKSIKQITREFTPLRVLLDEHLSARSMRAWGKVMGNGISSKINLYEGHPELQRQFLRKYKIGTDRSESLTARDFEEYLSFKAPEIVARNTLNGILSHGLHKTEKKIIGGIDSFGELLADGAKVVLPDEVADSLIGKVKTVKSLGEMGTKAAAYFYYMLKLKSSSEGQEGIKTAFDEARNPLHQKYFFHDLLTRRISKYICHTFYNKVLNDGAPEINTATVSQLAFWSVLWYLFNSGQSFDVASEIMTQIE